MALKVYKYGEKVLREKAVAVPTVDEKLRRLADEMLETMHSARGVGLAAQQIGRTERMCVIDIPEGCDEP
jgi:peptide deformylase